MKQGLNVPFHLSQSGDVVLIRIRGVDDGTDLSPFLYNERSIHRQKYGET